VFLDISKKLLYENAIILVCLGDGEQEFKKPFL